MEPAAVVKVLHCSCPADVAFRALASEDLLSQWSGAAVHFEPWAGGLVELRLDAWPDLSGEVAAFDPPSGLTIVWWMDDAPPLTTSFAVESSGAGRSTIRIIETGFGADDDRVGEREYLWTHWAARLSAVIGSECRPGGAA